MSEPLRPVSAPAPRGPASVPALRRVAERPRREGDDGERREPQDGRHPEPPAQAGPDADGHVDLLA